MNIDEKIPQQNISNPNASVLKRLYTKKKKNYTPWLNGIYPRDVSNECK